MVHGRLDNAMLPNGVLYSIFCGNLWGTQCRQYTCILGIE